MMYAYIYMYVYINSYMLLCMYYYYLSKWSFFFNTYSFVYAAF